MKLKGPFTFKAGKPISEQITKLISNTDMNLDLPFAAEGFKSSKMPDANFDSGKVRMHNGKMIPIPAATPIIATAAVPEPNPIIPAKAYNKVPDQNSIATPIKVVAPKKTAASKKTKG
jgi:hypothetical protein